MIAGSNTGRNAGEYVSIGVVPGTTSTTDVVVVVWYDQTERVLKYAYNDSPLTNRNGQTSGAGWKGVKTVFSDDSENAGEYCQLTVDAKGGIHIAAYDPTNCNLVYAYLSKYDDTPKTCVVDSNGVVGSNITIDVAMNGTGANAKAVPQTGYYATSCIRPKCAYPVNGIGSTTQEGSVDDEFTGAWECTVVPTARTVNMQSNQYNKMNVAVWKTSAGVLTNCADSTTFSQTKTTSENTYTNTPNSYSSSSYGFAYGNGTDNAIMGYTIKVNSTSDAIETAQMR